MTQDSFISVVIPSYNSDKYLDRALKSLNEQYYKNFEVIIIDNHSSDSTCKIIDEYRSKIKINLFKIKNEGIIAQSRNLGIKKSSGVIISFLDSDDYWHKQKLLRINELFYRTKFDVCCHNEIKINEKGILTDRLNYSIKSKDIYRDLLIFGNSLSTSAVSIKKEFIIEKNLYFSENKNYNTAEDYDLWLKLALNKAKMLFIKEYLGFYQFHNSSNSNENIDAHLDNVTNVIMDHLKTVKDEKLSNLVKTRLQLSKLKLLVKRKDINELLTMIIKFNLLNYKNMSFFIFLKILKFFQK